MAPRLKAKSRKPPKEQIKKFQQFVPVFHASAVEQGQVLAETMAKDIANEAKTVLRQQKYRWKDLTPRYTRYKQRKGLDPRKLIATGEYLRKIGWWQNSKGQFFAGVRPGARHEASGLPLWKLARIHEFGSRKMQIPARPLWRPVISTVVRRRKKYAAAYYLNTRRRLQKAGYKMAA
jgi:hypothetical protein